MIIKSIIEKDYQLIIIKIKIIWEVYMFRISCFADEISPSIKEQIRVMKELNLHYVELRSIDNKNNK